MSVTHTTTLSAGRSTRARSRRLIAGASAVLLLTALSGCGSDSDDAASSAPPSPVAPSVDPALVAMVPQEVLDAGTLVVGTDTTYAPVNFLAEDGTTIVGLDIDVLDTVAAHLGLDVQYQSAPFDSIIPGVQSGKYDMGASAFTINPERTQVVDMVSYFMAGTQWAVQTGNPRGVDPDNACGKVVAVQKGTVQVEDVTARSQACTTAGNAAITIDQYQGQDQATASVASGKSDAMLADSPVTAYAVTLSSGQVETLGDVYASAPYGWVVPNDAGDLADALAGAAAASLADGSYAAALEKWGSADGAISTFEVNPTVQG